MSSRKLITQVVVRLEIDIDEWNREYGTADDRETIRRDVRAMGNEAVDIALKHLQPHAVTSVQGG